MQLLKLQQQFRDVLLQKRDDSFLPLQGIENQTNSQVLLYQNNLYESLYKNLSDKFEMTKIWLGEEEFFSTAKEYIFTSCQRTPYLCEYGQVFSSMVSDELGRELAELEWRMNLSLVSYRAEPPLQFDDLVAIPPLYMSGFGFRLHSSVQLYTASYALKEIWAALKKGRKTLAYKKLSFFFIFTENQQSTFFPIDESEYNFLKMLGEGKSLGDVYDLVSDVHSFQALLNKFISYFVEIRKKPF